MTDQPAAPDLDVLTQLFAQNAPSSVGEFRRLLDGFAGMMNADLPEIGAFHEAELIREVDGTRVTADVHVPNGDGPHPVLVYLHGGGWVMGSPATHRKLAHRFAEAGFLVFNVDYRLGPEHRFPAGFDDCVEGVRFAAREAARFGGDAGRLAIGGDSAGGNLSAAVAAALADDPDAPSIRCALLIYGVFDFAKMSNLADIAPPLPGSEEVAGKMVDMMVEGYLGADRSQLLGDPRVSPIHAAAKLPPSHVMVGEADPLVTQAASLVGELERAGVEHEHFVDAGMPHGYAQMEFLASTRPAIDRMVAFLRSQLGEG